MTNKYLCRLYHLGLIVILLYGTGSLCFAQSDRGGITGTVADPANSVIPGVSVTATNEATGTQSKGVTTSAGYYTIPDLPAGTYSLTLEVAGFNKLIRNGITVSVNVTARVDLTPKVGDVSDTVTVTSDAPLLKTESSENNITITSKDINALPLNMAGVGAIRDPLSFAALAPGTTVGGWNDIHINGAPGATFRIILDGQDSNNGTFARASDETQPSVEALQEFTLQANSFPAEFGQTTGGIFNYTTKSGANAFHGSGYEYFVNEAFNAGLPFTKDAHGNPIRTRSRQNDFGGSIGGPVWIPKIYNGHDKTFFFFNYEMYRDAVVATNSSLTANPHNGLQTVPTKAYRNGDLSYLLTGKIIGTDPIGRPIHDGAIYDPTSTTTVNGVTVRNPFPNNYIDPSRFDPVAAKILSFIPNPTNDNPTYNYPVAYPANKFQWIPSIKLDHNLTNSMHLAGYYSMQATDKDNGGDGLPDPISARRYQVIRSNTIRVNGEDVLTPSLIVHAGFGFQRYWNPDTTPITKFDQASKLGLPGALVGGFPNIGGLSINGQGLNLGPSNMGLIVLNKPTAVASVSWIKGAHSFKFGGEWRYEAYLNQAAKPGLGSYSFDPSQTSLTSANGQNLNGGSIGSSFASFLLGAVSYEDIGNPTHVWWTRKSGAMYAQDNWKITRRATLEYGLRYDMQQKQHESQYRTSMFNPTIPNPAAGGLLGATQFEGNGAGRCNCVFEKFYPYAFGPRVGITFQADQKTVFHAAIGMFYGQHPAFNYAGAGNTLGFGFNDAPTSSQGYGLAANQLSNGIPYTHDQLYGTVFDAGIRPNLGTLNGAPSWFYPNNGRPPRTTQMNVGFQREIMQNMTLEAAYVGVRGAWFQANGLVNPNQLTQARLGTFGLNLNNPVDLALLAKPMSDPAVVARGFNIPYASYPTGSSLAQTLRPFPQFNWVGVNGANLGNYWYDSMQMKLTKRMGHGLWFLGAYTWSKDLGTVNDEWGDAVALADSSKSPKSHKTYVGADTPQILSMSYRWEIPTFGATGSGWKALLLKGWTTDGLLRYQSGGLIQVPNAQNGLTNLTFAYGNFADRVPNQKLFLHNLNSHNFNPRTEGVLNSAAWTDPAPGTYGTSKPFYSDYRGPRYPSESMGIGKSTFLGEKLVLSVRADFFNVFNRWAFPGLNNTGNALQTTQRDSTTGSITNGFGYIGDSIAGAGSNYSPRSGQIVARLQF